MNVEFDENNINSNRFESRSILGSPQTPKIIRFLINKKIVKNEKTAGVLLILITILCFIGAFYLFYSLSQPEPVRYNLSPDIMQSLPDEVKTKIYESQKK